MMLSQIPRIAALIQPFDQPQFPLEPGLRLAAGALGPEMRHHDDSKRIRALFQLLPARLVVQQLDDREPQAIMVAEMTM